jgi:thiol-disulfide isomerase/thioredoxin
MPWRGATVGRIFILALLLCLLILVCPRRVAAPAKDSPASPAQVSAPEEKPERGSSEEEQKRALEEAFRSAGNNPQALIKNLEGFLVRFPNSPLRPQVLRTIYNQALQANDPEKATTYGQKLLELNPDDVEVLAQLLDLLGRRGDASSRALALRYATQFVNRTEHVVREFTPGAAVDEKRRRRNALMLASAYLLRGEIYTKADDTEKAFRDFQKSYEAYPSAQVAERLGDLAAKKNDAESAIGYYATAFAFPEKDSDPAHRGELRRKLGSFYVARHHSERGLGDLILARYDELMSTLRSRFTEQRSPNADRGDPFDFVLPRPDGALIRLADYRGNVMVMEFWATWCSPCRLEGKLLEQALASFRNESRVAFLAVNVDEHREAVPAFVKEQQWTVPVAYAQGLDRLLGVQALPTLVIFDRHGRVMFRQQGLDPESFVPTLEKNVGLALGM